MYNAPRAATVVAVADGGKVWGLDRDTFQVETCSRIGLLQGYGNLQSYWTTTKLWKLTVVLDYYKAIETYSRIGLVRSYGNLQSYWTNTLTVVLNPS